MHYSSAADDDKPLLRSATAGVLLGLAVPAVVMTISGLSGGRLPVNICTATAFLFPLCFGYGIVRECLTAGPSPGRGNLDLRGERALQPTKLFLEPIYPPAGVGDRLRAGGFFELLADTCQLACPNLPATGPERLGSVRQGRSVSCTRCLMEQLDRLGRTIDKGLEEFVQVSLAGRLGSQWQIEGEPERRSLSGPTRDSDVPP